MNLSAPREALDRAAAMPCFCERSGCAELLHHFRRGEDVVEELRCAADDRTFRRVWVTL